MIFGRGFSFLLGAIFGTLITYYVLATMWNRNGTPPTEVPTKIVDATGEALDKARHTQVEITLPKLSLEERDSKDTPVVNIKTPS